MESVRYYQVPGMDHCAGGEGAYVVDWLSAMENWVEEGAMPEILEASHPASDTGEPFTRPLCAYPGIPRYSGAGDTADAANFFCGEPSPPAP